MENPPVKKNMWTPVKFALTGVFLVLSLSVPFILRARTVSLSGPEIITAPAAEGYNPSGTGEGQTDESAALNNGNINIDGNLPAQGSPGALPQPGQGGGGPAAPAARSSYPVRLIIPALGINTGIVGVGLTPSGDMDTPKSAVAVAWYKLGPKPGENGSAVIAGHINTRYSAHGVFEHLGDLSAGDKIQIKDGSGKTFTFTVTGKEYLAYDSPAGEIFTKTGKPRLNLITCAGTWLASKKVYDQRLVIYSELD